MPATGSGSSQLFSHQLLKRIGSNNVSTVYGLINSSLNGAGGCFSCSMRQTNALYLYNDAGTAPVGLVVPFLGRTISNSQCSINGINFRVTSSGNQLTIAVPITFSGSFLGLKRVYGYATDRRES